MTPAALRRDRRGTVAILSAALGAVLIGFAGLAVDTTRAWVAEARMKSALDAAALVAARRFDAPTRDAEATAMFWANIEQGNRGRSFLGATISEPTIAPVLGQNGQIRVSARVTTPTTLFNVIAAQNITRDDFAVARRGSGLELALVIDNTSSMTPTVAALGGITKLQAAKNAANRLIDILYGCRESPPNSGTWVGCRDTQPNLFVSLVPFTRNVNVGPVTFDPATGQVNNANAALNLARVSLDTSAAPPGWTSNDFNGCIEARTGAPSDAAPTGANSLRPFAWPSTFRRVGTVAEGRCTNANAWPVVNVNGQNVRYCHGDNDWEPAAGQRGRGVANINSNEMYRRLTQDIGLPAAAAVGPNLLCAPSAMQPLSARRTDIRNAVNAMTETNASGGTLIAPAMEGAWFTLSPRWQNLWRDPNTGLPDIPTLPRAYDAPNNRKAVILLSDGDNNWNSEEVYTQAAGRSVRSSAAGSERLYTAYGRVANWNSAFPRSTIDATSQASADAALDARFEAMCEAMKAAPNNIRIYVIGFEVGAGQSAAVRDAQRAMLRRCASLGDNGQPLYQDAADATALNTVFQNIAADLVRLRLVE